MVTWIILVVVAQFLNAIVAIIDKYIVSSKTVPRPILLTDSGNLGTWSGAYSRGDVFGTSVYVYLWNPDIGTFRTILPPSLCRVKESIARILFGKKQTFLIELSAEPWLLYPITKTPLDTQLDRMNIEKFRELWSMRKRPVFHFNICGELNGDTGLKNKVMTQCGNIQKPSSVKEETVYQFL